MPRYVILEHTGTPTYKPGVHWDLMLEAGETLRTWELADIPTAGATVMASPLPNHRLDYLEYEGPISNNRGTVRRWDCGTYQIVRETVTELDLQLAGRHIHGSLRLEPASPGLAGPWHVTLESS